MVFSFFEIFALISAWRLFYALLPNFDIRFTLPLQDAMTCGQSCAPAERLLRVLTFNACRPATSST
jgi:hypothetical protein